MIAIRLWEVVKTAKVLFVPIGTTLNKKGEEKTIFARTGIRVDMADGSWWFHHFKHDTWTRHFPSLVVNDCFGRPEPTIERKDSFRNMAAVVKEFGNRCPELITALEEGVEIALTEEAEKRKAA